MPITTEGVELLEDRPLLPRPCYSLNVVAEDSMCKLLSHGLLPPSRAQCRPKIMKNAWKMDGGLRMNINHWMAQADGRDLLAGGDEKTERRN